MNFCIAFWDLNIAIVLCLTDYKDKVKPQKSVKIATSKFPHSHK